MPSAPAPRNCGQFSWPLAASAAKLDSRIEMQRNSGRFAVRLRLETENLFGISLLASIAWRRAGGQGLFAAFANPHTLEHRRSDSEDNRGAGFHPYEACPPFCTASEPWPVSR